MQKIVAGLIVACLALPGLSSGYAEDQPEARAIIDKAVQATGGKEKLTKLKGLVFNMKGKVSVMGTDITFTAEASVQMPDKMRMQFDGDFMGNKFSRLQVVNGKKAWVSMGGNTMDMPEEEFANNKEEMYSDLVA